MKKTACKRSPRLRVFALTLTLLLVLGIVCPAAGASAEGFQFPGREEIADALETVRTNLEDKLAAAREDLQAAWQAGAGDLSQALEGLPELKLPEISTNCIDVDLSDGVTITIDTKISIGGSDATPSPSPSSTPAPTSRPSAGSSASTGMTSTSPKTGDLNNLVLWIVIVAVSALALAAVLFFLLRRRKK